MASCYSVVSTHTIGTLMEGSGLKEVLETVYGENAVVHMMTGKAVQRALLGHLLVDQCLTNQIVSQVIAAEQEFETQLLELEQLYNQIEKGDVDVDTLYRSTCVAKVASSVAAMKHELPETTQTSKLWINIKRCWGWSENSLRLIELDHVKCISMPYLTVCQYLPLQITQIT